MWDSARPASISFPLNAVAITMMRPTQTKKVMNTQRHIIIIWRRRFLEFSTNDVNCAGKTSKCLAEPTWRYSFLRALKSNWYIVHRGVFKFIVFFHFAAFRFCHFSWCPSDVAAGSEKPTQKIERFIFRFIFFVVMNVGQLNVLRFHARMLIDKNVISQLIETSYEKWLMVEAHANASCHCHTHTHTHMSPCPFHTSISHFNFNKFCLFSPNINICTMFFFQLKSLFDWMFR